MPLNQVIVVSLEMFTALHAAGAPFDYLDWLRVAGWATVCNMIGGLLLVTTMRLVQVGGDEIRRERERPDEEPREEEA